jgi:hypothetical protein
MEVNRNSRRGEVYRGTALDTELDACKGRRGSVALRQNVHARRSNVRLEGAQH